MSKHFFCLCLIFTILPLAACSTNPATGQNQFAALMPASQEESIGAQEHEKVLQQYTLYEDRALQSYVQSVGARVVQNTERADVRYQFFLLDSPVVNAFALPGGYIYVTRGLLALADSEAELASVLAHEAGHITARHSAERFSRGMVASLGAAVLGAAIGDSSVSDLLGVGTDLYIKSYSRGQENQADALGIRYLSRAGYDPRAMSGFLNNLLQNEQLEARLKGHDFAGGMSYFSTHPATQERVQLAAAEAQNFPPGGQVERDSYIRRLNGMTYGDSAAQGFVRDQNFYHPQMGFAFTIPQGFEVVNQPDKVVLQGDSGAVVVFDMAPNRNGLSPRDFLQMVWVEGENIGAIEDMQVNGIEGATGMFAGSVNGAPMTLRLIALEWGQQQMARFLVALPPGLSARGMEDLQRLTYSFRRMSGEERERIRPLRIRAVTAKAGDSAASMARLMAVRELPEDKFRVLNGLEAGEPIRAGQVYKVVGD